MAWESGFLCLFWSNYLQQSLHLSWLSEVGCCCKNHLSCFQGRSCQPESKRTHKKSPFDANWGPRMCVHEHVGDGQDLPHVWSIEQGNTYDRWLWPLIWELVWGERLQSHEEVHLYVLNSIPMANKHTWNRACVTEAMLFPHANWEFSIG